MEKQIIFDMDGTIVNLYSVPNWFERLRKFDVSVYEEAEPIYKDMNSLIELIWILKDMGYKVSVVTWGSKESTNSFDKQTEKAKIEWLKRYNIPYDEFFFTRYGVPKENFVNCETAVLVDDNKEVCENFLKNKNDSIDSIRKVINASENILSQLINLIIESDILN